MSDNNAHSPHIRESQLNEYLDGCLAEIQVTALELHLDTCLDCAARLKELQMVFSGLETLPDIVLECDFEMAVMSALQPQWKLSQRWKLGALTQLVLAVLVMLLAVPSLLKTWQPLLQEMQQTITMQLSEQWITLVAQWSFQLAEFQFSWARLFSQWQPPSILEASQISVWPLFLTAILLFIFGNGLMLRKVLRNGIRKNS